MQILEILELDSMQLNQRLPNDISIGGVHCPYQMQLIGGGEVNSLLIDTSYRPSNGREEGKTWEIKGSIAPSPIWQIFGLRIIERGEIIYEDYWDNPINCEHIDFMTFRVLI